uniref:Uncharacterized protein P0446G09.103 n=2 Tax=Oryza sativa subsp. japonica TaxID=39947 RepID=Q7F0A3_ORYSJ|nr:hypothetical protein [Oryza sativa Japonica Group]BAD31247.1 hypothetical protein [Oryza sativa Japonica Group]
MQPRVSILLQVLKPLPLVGIMLWVKVVAVRLQDEETRERERERASTMLNLDEEEAWANRLAQAGEKENEGV